MPKVKEIAAAIEEFAPRCLQESYDNSGLQVGDPEMDVRAALICLDVTEEILQEALARDCNMVISHHPLLFKGLKDITGRTPQQRIVACAIRHDIAIYAAHTNLDSAWDGVSHEMARLLGLTDLQVLVPGDNGPTTGLGLTGLTPKPVPAMEFLRRVRDTFHTKCLRYSTRTPKLVIRKVALCGGAGASMIKNAIDSGADVFVTGDIKYHDFTDFGLDILLADIGHYESELCSGKIFSRIIREKIPNFVTYYAQAGKNPVGFIC